MGQYVASDVMYLRGRLVCVVLMFNRHRAYPLLLTGAIVASTALGKC